MDAFLKSSFLEQSLSEDDLKNSTFKFAAKVRNYIQTELKFWSKSKFWSKIKICVKNQILCEKSNFCQKSNFM